jgi:hypothetical protein
VATCNRESEYKYHFKKWKWKKNLSSSKKEKLLKIRQKRAEAGKSTLFQDEISGKRVDEKQLRRYLKESMRRDTARMHARISNPMDLKALTGSSFTFGSSM